MWINKHLKSHDFLSGEPKTFIRRKGSSFLEVGYIYVPYIPRYDYSEIFNPRTGVSSRYAERGVNNRFYGTLTV